MDQPPADLERLRAAWAELAEPFGAGPTTVQDVFRLLVDHYGSGPRFYHTLGHVQEVLATVEPLLGRARDAAAVRFAAWFHDVVYDPRAADNEERSAAVAAAALRQLRVPEATVARTAALIRMTKTHHADDGDPDGPILLDADLAILGAAEARYAEYSQAIRREYAWVPEEQYRVGRREVLQRFLRRQRIYRTDDLFASHEAQARRNLAREIVSLAEPA